MPRVRYDTTAYNLKRAIGSGMFTGLMFLSILVADFHFLLEHHHAEVCTETEEDHWHGIPEEEDCLLCNFTATWVDEVISPRVSGPFYGPAAVVSALKPQLLSNPVVSLPALRGPPTA